MADDYTPCVKAIPAESGCTFVRHGKGGHAIWRSPINGRHFMVDGHIKSRHWANHTLKRLGLRKRSEA